MLISVICVALGLQSLPEPQVVGCDEEVRRIADLIHKPIKVDPELAAHVLLIRASNASAPNELDRIADVLNAQVDNEGAVLHLRQSPEKVKAARAKRSAERAKWLERSLANADKMRSDFHADVSPRSAIIAMADAFRTEISGGDRHPKGIANQLCCLSPEGGLALAILKRIGAPTLASMPNGLNHIFESKPVPGTFPVEGADSLLADYNGSLQALGTEEWPAGMKDELNYVGIHLANPEPAASRFRLRVVAQDSFISASFESFDSTGRIVGTGTFMAQALSGPIGGSSYISKFTPATNSSDIREIPQQLLDRIESGKPTPSRLSKWLTQPTKFEPLSALAAFGITTLVNTDDNAPIIADLNDQLVHFSAESATGNKFNRKAFKAILDQWLGYEVIEIHGWKLIKLKNPDLPLSVNRFELERYCTDTAQAGWEDSRRLGALYLGRQEDLIGAARSELSRTNGLQSLELRAPGTGILQIIARISDEDWAALKQGNPLTAGQLGLTDALTTYFNDAIKLPAQPSLPDLYRYPAELFENTPVSDVVLKLSRESSPRAKIIVPHSKEKPKWLEVGEIVHKIKTFRHSSSTLNLHDETRQEFEAWMDSNFGCASATVNEEILTLSLPHDQKLNYRLPLPLTDQTDQGLYSDLPAQLRAMIWQSISEERKPSE